MWHLVDSSGSALKGVLHNEALSCDIVALCQMLAQYDGSAEYFHHGPVMFNPANGEPSVHLGNQRSDGLWNLIRLPPKRYYRLGAINKLSQAAELKREKLTRLHRDLGHPGKTKMKAALL